MPTGNLKLTSLDKKILHSYCQTLDGLSNYLGNGYEAIYGQLTDVSLEAGQKVQKAARIGAVAAPTKYYVKEGSNLFFEMKKDGKAIDPMAYLPAISE